MHLLHRFSVYAAQFKDITTSKTKFPVCLSCDTRVQGLFQFDLYIVVAKHGNPSRFLGTLSLFLPILSVHGLVLAYYNNFIGHCGVFCGLKWKIQRAKIYFSPLL